jgi:hypothetical protein
MVRQVNQCQTLSIPFAWMTVGEIIETQEKLREIFRP